MNSKMLVTMGGIAVGSCAIEKICMALGKQDIAQYVGIFGASMVGTTAIAGVYSFLNVISKNL